MHSCSESFLCHSENFHHSLPLQLLLPARHCRLVGFPKAMTTNSLLAPTGKLAEIGPTGLTTEGSD
eukprot:2609963-Amphidinium_carterae.1